MPDCQNGIGATQSSRLIAEACARMISIARLEALQKGAYCSPQQLHTGATATYRIAQPVEAKGWKNHCIAVTHVRACMRIMPIMDSYKPERRDASCCVRLHNNYAGNMTRADAHDFLALASELKIQPQVSTFPLKDVNKVLLTVKEETGNGSAVIVP